MKQYTYLLIDFACLFIPLIASFYPKHAFYKHWKSFFSANLLVALFFILWDILFTARGVWGFNSEYLCGLTIANLPVEEILFFICIPYACVFTYFSLSYFFTENGNSKILRSITIVLILLLLIIGLFNLEKQYTAVTFLLTAAYLTYILFKGVPMKNAYLSYLFIFPFFLISNGLLTGTYLEEPVVWYNDAENLFIRLGTIPVEDSVYGFLLIIMNINLFDWFKKKSSQRRTITE